MSSSPPAAPTPTTLPAGRTPVASPSEPSEETLGEYIDKNHKVLQVLGVFIVLTGFGTHLTGQPGFNLLLTGLFFACVVLVGLGARGRLPSRGKRSERLRFFAYCFEAALVLLVAYGVVQFHPIYRVVTGVVMAVVLWVILFLALLKVKPFATSMRTLIEPAQASPRMRRWAMQGCAIGIIVSVFVVLLLIFLPLTSALNAWLDGLGRLLGNNR